MSRFNKHSNHSQDLNDDNSETTNNEDLGGKSNSHTRLLVTNEGNLDPTLLIRTKGFMYKKGGAVNARGGFRNWKKRWFVLAPVEFLGVAQGYELQYYDSPNGNLKGRVGLSEVELFCEERSAHNKKVKYEFQIVLQAGGVLQLSCDTAEERDEWIETLNMVIAFLRKILTATAMTLDGYDPQFEDDEESHRIGEEIAQNCQAYGAGLFGSEAGQQAQFVIQLHDLLGQQVTKGGMPITATISSELPEYKCLYYLRVIDNEDGSYYAQYMLGRSGRYKLSVMLNDEHHIFGSPFDMEILPSRTSAAHSVAQGDALEEIVVSIPNKSTMASIVKTFTIVAMDNFGNRKNRGGDPFEVGIMVASGSVVSNANSTAQLRALTDMGDGSYVCEVEATYLASEMHKVQFSQQQLILMVTLHGKHISGSPFKPVLTTVSGQDHKAISQISESIIESNASVSSVASPSMVMQPSEDISIQQSTFNELPSQLTPPSKGYSENSVNTGRNSTGLNNAEGILNREDSNSNNGNNNLSSSYGSPGSTATKGGAGTVSSGPMSRLERSRQRALLAKSLAEGSPNTSSSPKDNGTTLLSGHMKLSQAATRGASNLAALKHRDSMIGSAGVSTPIQNASEKQGGLDNSSSNQHNVTTLASILRQGLGGYSANSGEESGMGPPPNATPNECKIWDHTHRALHSNEEVLKLLCSQFEALQQLFSLFSSEVEGVSVIKLVTSSSASLKLQQSPNRLGGSGGVYRMLELFDVLPTYLSRVEAKVLFGLALYSQSNFNSPAAIAGGGTGLEFAAFLKFLVMLAYHALSKTNSFSTMYNSMEAKIEVMLFKWGLAEPMKLQVVRQALINPSK